MNFIDIINLKKNKQELKEEQINYFVQEYAIKKNIPDYQASSFLMACRLNGLSNNEVFYLTKAFIDSSIKYNFEKNDGDILIDKHSSGGVGDKVSIILIPILVAFDIYIPKISGRGLGHTGGTIDKLESINVNCNLSFDEANEIFKKANCVIMEQTSDLVPADKTIYALRDVTSTVDCEGLIVSSILSKKFVINSDLIFIDLKVGSGAIFSTIDKATELANILVDVSTKMNRKINISISNMDQPLGKYIGNFLEIKESIEFLQGINQAPDLKELIYEFVSEILIATKKITNKKDAFAQTDKMIESLLPYQNFITWIEAQGGDVNMIDNYYNINAKYKKEIFAKDEGYIKYKSASELGMIAAELGASRKTKLDKIDNLAGIFLNKQFNDKIKRKDLLAILYSSKPIQADLITRFGNNVEIAKEQFQNGDTIIKTINNIK